MGKARTAIRAAQEAWARRTNRTLDGVCLKDVQANLFPQVDDRLSREFDAGGGGEMRGSPSGRRAKMRSVRSSSALAVNFFEPLRNADLSPLSTALGLDFVPVSASFERKVPHGLASEPPNLDVFLNGPAGQGAGIEVKFLEPYDVRKSDPTTLRPDYFPSDFKRWSKVGLPRCQAFAEALRGETLFEHLHAAQLLKHLLGLGKRAMEEGDRVRLVYLWFDLACEEARLHEREVEEFAARLDDTVWFRAMTFQKLFPAIRDSLSADHRAYLQDRYFFVQGKAPTMTEDVWPSRPFAAS